MSPAGTLALPTVLATSVIRSTHQGQSHGGVFLVDLASGDFVQVIDWNEGSISWAGRGGDRGLRGIAFHDRKVLLAASDEVFVYDQSFERQGSIRSPYLKHCHEIDVQGDLLYLTSTGFDAILVFDLETWRFREGICLRRLALPRSQATRYRVAKALGWRLARYHPALYRVFTANLRPARFDPLGDVGPEPTDMLHINAVRGEGDAITFCGTELDALLALDGERLERIGRVPLGTHNTRRERGTLIYHDTARERVVVEPADSAPEIYRLPRYDPASLRHDDLGPDHARQGFGRGLCLHGDLLIVGSSPATITVFRRGDPLPVTSVNLTLDIRNAVHGLEVWPFETRPGGRVPAAPAVDQEPPQPMRHERAPAGAATPER